MPHHLDVVIKELEFARQSDRELDNMIVAALARPMPDDPVGWPPRFTFSIDEALKLIPLEFIDWWNITRGKVGIFNVEVRRYYDAPYLSYDCCASASPVAPIAICIVALKARRKMTEYGKV